MLAISLRRQQRARRTTMARSYYSTVFEHSADEVWNTIRDFNNYPVWVDGAGDSRIEHGRSGDAVGAVRDVLYRGKRIRQQLLALSDIDRSQTYGFCGAPPAPLQDYRATIRVTPVVEGDRAFVEWDATFDCEGARHAELTEFYRDAFATWLGSLRRTLERQAHAA
jgi:polyketide cyclase/dehydrase/lipid transport protein